MSTINPYAVHWCIIQFEREITQIASVKLTRHGFNVQGNLAMRHCPTKERAEEMQTVAVADMKELARTGRAFIITDKQFSMGTTKYKGELLRGSAETIGGITGVQDDWVTYFPATSLQISESVKF